MDVVQRNKVSTVDGGGDCEDEMVERLPSKNWNRATGYLTPKAGLAFTKLRKVFTKPLILQHFDLKCHI